ncbi:MAG: hypothetical protein QOJ67_3172 [Acidimicrobiaceae bacterium]|jgi:hypothetical protein
MAVRSSARPADLEAYRHETDVIAGYLLRHADDLDRALIGVHAPVAAGVRATVAHAAGVRATVARMRALGGWVEGLAEAFAVAGGAGPSVGATSLVTADAAAIERSVGIDPARPYELAQRSAPFAARDVSIGDIIRDHLWDGFTSLWPGGETPADVALDSLRDLARQLAPGILNQMLRMRAYGRAPDYVVVEADAFTPFFGLGGGAFITYSRSGRTFVAPEGGVGVPGAGVSVRAGWLDQDDLPSGTDVDNFIEGFAVTGSLGVGTYAVAATWNVGSDITDVSFEEGAELGEDPGSISLSYSADVGDAGCAWTD